MFQIVSFFLNSELNEGICAINDDRIENKCYGV